MKINRKRWGIIGLGNMASAMLRGAFAAGELGPHDVLGSRRDETRRKELERSLGIETTDDNSELIARCDTVLLALKPQQAREFFATHAAAFNPNQTLVSVLAGVTTTTLRSSVPCSLRVIRTMPNTPSLIGRGVTLVTGDELTNEVDTFLRASGSVVHVDESQFDQATAISGCGPAYVFLLAEALTSAGQVQGLAPELSKRLAYETLYGAAALLEARSNELDATELRRRVTSPGGATAAAIGVLQARGIEQLFCDAVGAAQRRATALGD